MTEAERRALEDARAACLASAETIAAVLSGSAVATAVHGHQIAPLGYVSLGAAANATGIEKDALRARARRAHRDGSGLARKVGGRWQIRLADLI